MGGIESGYDRSDLPRQLEGISNESNFLDIYKKIESWYNKDFTDNEFKIIKDTWNNGCKDLGTLNSDRIRKLGNMVDSGLFRLNYPKFVSLDDNILGLEDSDSQRNFREIIMKLEHEFDDLYNSETSLIIETLKNEIQKKPGSNSPIFEQTYNDLLKKIKDNRNIENDNSSANPEQQEGGDNPEFNEFDGENLRNTWKNTPGRIPEREIELMVNIPISEESARIKELVMSNIAFDNLHYFDGELDKVKFDDDKVNYIRKYLEGVFNDFAKQIEDHFGGDIPLNIFDENIGIIVEYFNSIIAGQETSSKNLVQGFLEKLYENDDILELELSTISRLETDAANQIDRDEVDKIEVTDKEINEIKIITHRPHLSEKIIYDFKLYKYLNNKKAKNGKLSPDLENLLERLRRTFTYVKKRVLKQISITSNEGEFAQEYTPSRTDSLAEYTTGNIKDIKPIAIVEHNEAIRDFVYGEIQDRQSEGVEDIEFSNLDDNYKKELFQRLIDNNKNDQAFMDSIKYLDEYGRINSKKARADNIDPRSLNNNRLRIERMIVDLARQDMQMEGEKSKIKEISIKRSAMVCCFRAISTFFNTVNNNGENFASEFEISSDEDIKFDNGIITMEGMIGANKNHVKLYYDTNTGTLEFDNFLAYDSETNSYKIGLGTGEKERININLPTMEQMQEQASSVNLSLVDRLPLNIEQYERMVSFAMGESIRLNCFVGFMGADIKVNQMLVEQFNEKNILKQDIINNIYNKFYNQSDIKEKLGSCLLINEGNEPEQFKLIKMISDTIDNCGTSSELLRFRNAMNELDDILTNNHELVNDDPLLKYLFSDNLGSESDITDNSKDIMRRENEDLNISPSDNIASYESDQQYENRGNQALNYGLFLELLSEQGIVNLDAFEFAINTIKTTGEHLLDNQKEERILWRNYKERVNKDFPDLTEIERVQKSTTQELLSLEQDIRLDNELGEQLDEAYS